MADLFVDNAGSNTSPYDTWAKAATALLTATAAAAAGDSIYVAETHAETLTADTTYTMASGVRIICVNNDGGGSAIGAPSTTAAIDGSGTSGVDIKFQGPSFYVYGLNLTCGGSTGTGGFGLADSAADNGIFQKCSFTIANNSAGTVNTVGNSGNDSRAVLTIQCSFTWGAIGQGFTLAGGRWESVNDDFCAGATAPTVLFKNINESDFHSFTGADFSDIAGTIFESFPSKDFVAHLWGCSLHASTTVFSPGAGTSPGGVFLHDCAAGDVHYAFGHYNSRGTTIAGTTIYPTGGAKYDGTNPVSWTIAGNANTTKADPYFSPWIDDYNATLSSMTPYLEAVRNGSATKYNDDEVWSAWMAKTTSGSCRATYYSEGTIAGTPTALESSSLGASDWTGENATAAFMKLRPDAAFTPAEIGAIRARIAVSGNLAITVDPLIRY